MLLQKLKTMQKKTMQRYNDLISEHSNNFEKLKKGREGTEMTTNDLHLWNHQYQIPDKSIGINQNRSN